MTLLERLVQLAADAAPVSPLGTVAGIVTASATLLTALGGVLLAVKVILPTHKLVNQQRTDMLNFQMTLIKTLQEHGIDIPDDQSKNTPPAR